MINILKKREYPQKINKAVIAAIIFLFSITYYLSSPGFCKLNAYSVSDYCFRYSIEINNLTGSVQSHIPVLLPSVDMDYWHDQDYIDEFGWSIYPFQSTLVTEYNVMLQDLYSTASNQWYVMPSLTTGSNQLNVLLGANDIQRNQGIYFYTNDYVQIPNHNDFNQLDFNIKVELEDPLVTALSPTSTETILEKYDEFSNQGFKLEYIDSGSVAIARGYVNGWSIDTNPFIPSGNDVIEFSYNNTSNTLNISINNVSSPTVSGAFLTTNTQDLYFGTSYDGSSYSNQLNRKYLRVIDMEFGGDLVAYYGFNPKDITQSSAVNPNYSGVVEDISNNPASNTNNGTYFFDRDQTNISVLASNIVPSSASGTTIFTSETVDVLGRWDGSGNPSNLATTNQNFIGLSFLTPDPNLKLPSSVWYALWLSAFGVVIAISIFWLTNSIPVSLFAASMPLVLGSVQGLLNTWFMVIWFLLFMGIYSTYQWYERS